MIWGNILDLTTQVTGMRCRFFYTFALIALQGCAQPPQSEPAIAEPEQKTSTPIAPSKKKAIPIQVVIFVSDDIPAYTEVANHLAKELGQRGSIHYLTGSQVDNIKTVAQFKSEEHIQFVSIGLNASIATKSLANKQVVFCQVYNYQDYALLTPRHKGVSMLPSLAKTFSTWRSLAPGTTHIGVISGPGFDDVIKTARTAARIYGFTLHHEAVNSDKEYQYAYKKMSKKVQGYWLLPDNRILSEHILRDVMTYSVRNRKQVVVFSEELLKLGGLFSIHSDHRDIAQQVLTRLEQAQAKETIPGPDMVYLEKLDLRINTVMARHFNIVIPKQFRKYANAP